MYNRYGRQNRYYMAFFWIFIGFILGQLLPDLEITVREPQSVVPSRLEVVVDV